MVSPLENLKRAEIFSQYTRLAQQSGAVNLAQGIPEALADDEINSELISALEEGWQYSDAWGLPDLRRAVVKLYANEFELENVLITSGCTESIYVGLRGLAHQYGCNVAFFEPFYPYYVGIAELVGLKPVFIGMRWDHESVTPDWAALEDAMKRDVRILIVNTPHNPTGWVLRDADAIRLRALADAYDVFILIDEAYKYFVYDEVLDSATRQLYAGNSRCLIAGSASKLLSASGIRVGWLLGKTEALHQAHATHMHTSYCQPAPLQKLVASLITKRNEPLSRVVRDRYRTKRDMLLGAIRGIGLKCSSPTGGHFLLVDYSDLCGDVLPGEFARQFADRYRVVPLPANPFYMTNREPRQLRFSFAVALDVIEQAVSRICS